MTQTASHLLLMSLVWDNLSSFSLSWCVLSAWPQRTAQHGCAAPGWVPAYCVWIEAVLRARDLIKQFIPHLIFSCSESLCTTEIWQHIVTACLHFQTCVLYLGKKNTNKWRADWKPSRQTIPAHSPPALRKQSSSTDMQCSMGGQQDTLCVSNVVSQPLDIKVIREEAVQAPEEHAQP